MKNVILFLVSAIYLSACGGVTPIPGTKTLSPITETPTPPKITTQTNTPYPTNTAIATPYIGWETPTPETVFGYPTPLMPVELDPFGPGIPVRQERLTSNELYIGKYVIRNWCKTDETIKDYCAITISSLDEKQVEIWGMPVYLAPETGTDLTGNKYPDIVVVSGIGNAAGEVIVRVFEAGSTLEEILQAGSRREIKFVDLNNDKSFEFIGYARIWSKFSDCQVLGLPFVYEYNKKSGYVIQTSKFKEITAPSIQWGLDTLHSYKIKNPNAEVPLCYVYVLVSAYLVSGQKEKAWDILDENYPAATAAEYKIGFEKDLGRLIP